MSKKPKYETLSEIILKAVQTLRPSERLPVSIAAARYRYIRNVGSYTGQWRNSTVPYMIEPMNMLASEYHDQTIMVAPAQSGKTDSLILNWVLYSVVVDPMDLINQYQEKRASLNAEIDHVLEKITSMLGGN